MKSLALFSMLMFTSLSYADVILPEQLQGIKAVQQVDKHTLTAGLPSEAQIPQLKQAGVDMVINLMPDSTNKEYQNEAELVKAAGMEYVAIPVDWQNPQMADVDKFFNVMLANQGKDIMVHCLANYRASAFVYLYEVTHLGKSDSKTMAKTMTPWGEDIQASLAQYPQWQTLIDNVKAKYGN